MSIRQSTRRSSPRSSGCRYAELDSQQRSPLNHHRFSGRVVCRRDRQCIWVQSHRVPAHLLCLVPCHAQAFIPESNMLHPSLSSTVCCSAHRCSPSPALRACAFSHAYRGAWSHSRFHNRYCALLAVHILWPLRRRRVRVYPDPPGCV